MSHVTTQHRTPAVSAGREKRPSSTSEAAELLRATQGSVLLRGGATKLDWAGRVDEPDLLIDTSDLAGVLTHNPADMTASVGGGTRLTELQRHLKGDGQWLALDPPTAETGATVAGLLAAGDSGPSRLRYGGIRDLVIGVTLILADGTVARAGGHVIKNVAGYDLAKLVHGSLGSLAMIAEVVVRLHPLPSGALTITGTADADQATAAAVAIAAGPFEPSAVEWISQSGSGTLLVKTEGAAGYLDSSRSQLTSMLDGLGVTTRQLSDEDAETSWQEHAAAVRGEEQETVVRICTLPTRLGGLTSDALDIAAAADVEARLISSVSLGMHTVRFRGGDAQGHATAFTELRERALAQGASVLLRSRSFEVDELVDALGPPPSTVELLKRIKTQFDPAGRFAPQRFHPWY